jgi:acyl-homoserine-lactone acylase
MNLATVSDTRPDGPAGADGKLSAAELERAAIGNRSFMADLLRDEVVKRCDAAAARASAEKPATEAEAAEHADLANACETLRTWDGRFDLKGRGAVLWREFLGAYDRDDYYEGTQFAEPFDARRPLETPRGLAPAPANGPDPVITHLETAVERLRDAGIDPFRATLGEVQFTERGGERIPIHGATGLEGVTNYAAFAPDRTTLLPHMDGGQTLSERTGLSTRGYPVNYGTSFLLVLAFTDSGPSARAITTYSASSDPSSPHFNDQTEMWSRKELRPVLFTDQEIEADPNLEVQRLPRP